MFPNDMPHYKGPDSKKNPEESLADDFSDLELIEYGIDKNIQDLSKFPEAQARVARLQLVARLTTEAYQRGEIEETDVKELLDKEVNSQLKDMYSGLVSRDQLIAECDEFLQQPNLDENIKAAAMFIRQNPDLSKDGVPDRIGIAYLSQQLASLIVQQNIRESSSDPIIDLLKNSKSPLGNIIGLLRKAVDRLRITGMNKD